ncbi:MAG: O-antigen ligase family protein, partial [Candidatus Eisenbacteria bacterium]
AVVFPLAAIESRRDFLFASIILLGAAAAAAALGLVEQAGGAGNHPERLDGPIGFYMTTAGVFLLAALAALGVAALASFRWGGIALLLLVPALLFTYTRGAWFALAAGISVLLLRRRPRFLFPALLVLLAVLAGVPSLRERLLTSWDPGFFLNRERVYLWDAGLRLFLEHPWHGAGLHDLRETIRAARPPEAREPLTHFHSLYLQTAVAMGAPGLLALAILFLGFFRALVRASREAPPGLPRAVAEGAIAGVAAFLVHGAFEWNLGDSEVALTLYVVVGMGIAAGRIPRSQDVSFSD